MVVGYLSLDEEARMRAVMAARDRRMIAARNQATPRAYIAKRSCMNCWGNAWMRHSTHTNPDTGSIHDITASEVNPSR